MAPKSSTRESSSPAGALKDIGDPTAGEYTGMPASTTTQSTGALKGYPGTQVTLKIQATKPLKALTLVELGEERALAIDGTGTAAIAHLTIEKSGEYSLTLLDTDGLENLNAIVFPIVAMEDQAPTVKILKPGGEVHLGLEDSLPLHWEAIDDFGIAQQELIWTVPGREPGSIRLDPDASTHEWSLREAWLLGLFQAIALIPGTSRSGITITGARFLGYKRADAAKVSMLMSIPVILASAVLLGAEVIQTADATAAKDGAIAAAFAFASALLALTLMMRLLRSVSFTPYVIYRVVLGIGLIWWAWP